MDGLLERDLFEERKAALLAEQQAVEENLAALDNSKKSAPQRLADFLERLDSAYSLYQSGTPEEKREMVALCTSNLTAQGKEVELTATPEVQLVAERAKNSFGGVKRNRPRTAVMIRMWETLLLKLRTNLENNKVRPGDEAYEFVPRCPNHYR